MIIARAIRKKMPEYDYVYLGDTKRVPYGSRSHETVYQFTRECIDFLLRKENCALVIVACNTASARALRRIQREYLPKKFPNRKVIGVLIPAAEEAAKFRKIGILATVGTVASKTFPAEIKKINRNAQIFQNAAPMLVPLAEAGENPSTGSGQAKQAKSFLAGYLGPLIAKKPEALVLGCTHYPIFKSEIKKLLPKKVKIISQDEIIPAKLKNYLKSHPEISKKLSQGGSAKILVTDITPNVKELSRKWFGKVKPKLIFLS